MESAGSIIIGVILIASMIAPFWLIIRSVNKREKKLERAQKEIQEKYELNFDGAHEIWNEKLIGLDSKRKWLAFLSLSEKNPNEKLIDLSKIEAISVQQKTSVENGKTVINQVELLFKVVHEMEKRERVVLFDTVYDDPMEGGFNVELAKRWASKAELLLPKKEVRRYQKA